MKHIVWRWVAASSLLLAALAANSETRPQYGGTLYVAMREAPVSLDPADRSVADSFARRGLTGLIFETLVAWDESGRIKPTLAESWQSQGNQRWEFHLRRGVRFHDGTPLTPEIATASLRFADPTWNVTAQGDNVIIASDVPLPELLAQLSLPRNAIVKRDRDRPAGTGPFHIVNWDPGKELGLAANEDCWRGRPFLDSVEIAMGRSFRDQLAALQLGRADLVEIAPEQAHRISPAAYRIQSSQPMELLALMFARDASSPEESALREALGLSIERGSIRDVLLQRAGQPAGGIIPAWITGYGFVFSASADLSKARQLRETVRTVPAWKLGYDANDPLGRMLAERIALNANDAGLTLQATSSPATDLRLVRIPLTSPDAPVALSEIAGQAGLPTPRSSGSVEDLYHSEQALLATHRLIPLFHLPVSYASSSTLRNWTVRIDGSWNLADAWLESTKP